MLAEVLTAWVEKELKQREGETSPIGSFQKAIAAACPVDLKPPTTQAIEKWRSGTVGFLTQQSMRAIALYRGWSISQVKEWLQTGSEVKEGAGLPELFQQDLSKSRVIAQLSLIAEWCDSEECAIVLLPYVTALSYKLSQQLSQRQNLIFLLLAREFERAGMSLERDEDIQKFLGAPKDLSSDDRENLETGLRGKTAILPRTFPYLRLRLLEIFQIDLSKEELEALAAGDARPLLLFK